jgi:hypothetical protein
MCGFSAQLDLACELNVQQPKMPSKALLGMGQQR